MYRQVATPSDRPTTDGPVCQMCSEGEGEGEFVAWLSALVGEWGGDGQVLGEYLARVLDSDDTADGRREALRDVLADFVVDEKLLGDRVDSILDRWDGLRRETRGSTAAATADAEDRLVALLGSHSHVAHVAERLYTDDEKKIRDAILKQYSQLSDDDDERCQQNGDDDAADGNLARNTNAATVAAAAKERRERAKLESQRKKEKDKEDREKQKQLKEEKKEKRKTQKGERKR